MTVFRLLTYNIRYGGKGREDALITTINGCTPDLVLLQEATNPEVVDRLAGSTGMKQWATFRRQSLGFGEFEAAAAPPRTRADGSGS